MASPKSHSNVCGVCHDWNANRNKTYFCPGCMNFRLLKTKLNALVIARQSRNANRDVGNILDSCLEGNATATVGKATIDQIDNSILKLAYVILNVENSQIDNSLKQLENHKDVIKKRNDQLVDKIRKLKDVINSSTKQLDQYKVELTKNYDERISKIQDSLKVNVLKKQDLLISSSRIALVRDIMQVFSIQILGDSCVSILNTPIIPVANIVNYTVSYVNASMRNLGWFIDRVSRYSNISVPFEMVLRGSSCYLMDRRTSQLYDLSLHSDKITNLVSIFQLSPTDVLQFSQSFARLMINMLRVLSHYKELAFTSFDSLMKTDLLVKYLVEMLDKDDTPVLNVPISEVHHLKGKWYRFWNKSHTKAVSIPTKELPTEPSSSIIDTETVELVTLLPTISTTKLESIATVVGKSKTTMSKKYPIEAILNDVEILESAICEYIFSEIASILSLNNQTSDSLESSASSEFQQISIPGRKVGSLRKSHTNLKDRWEVIGNL